MRAPSPHHPQPGCLPLARLLNAALVQDPAFNLGVPPAQQIQRPAPVMLLGGGAGLVPHDLRANPGGALDPLRQGAEGAAQAVQGKRWQPGSGKGLVVVSPTGT